tara:strand:- start:317 stop:664 length:348 start_codon:yes stop_codon:yes gene_type:complete
MTKLLLTFILSLFSSSVFAESYFCGTTGTDSKVIYERSHSDVFRRTDENGYRDFPFEKLVYESDESIYLMGSFQDFPSSGSLKIINKRTGDYAVIFLSTAVATEPYYGDCLIKDE